jgi:drug/metabolite transporter (DMT)-like permease
VKLALPEIPPMTQAAVRSFGALFVILIGARLRGVEVFRSEGWGTGIALGLLFGLEFVMIYLGLVWTTATRAVTFLYTAPFFVALGATAFLGERLSMLQWCGMALAFAGLLVAFGAPQAGVDATVLLGDLMIVGGAIFWAATTLMFKASRLAQAPAERAMAWQLAVSVPVLGLAALLARETMTAIPGPVAMASMAYQTIWVVGCTFLIWYALMKTYPASKLSAFTFVTPLFGVAAGHFALGEPITAGFAVAVILVVAGLVLVNRR